MSEDGKLMGEYGKARAFEKLDAEQERQKRDADGAKLKALLASRLDGSDEAAKVASKPVQQPSVGRAVHFTPGGLGFEAGTFFHATIAKINADGTVNLGCLDLDGCAFPLQGVAYAAGAPAGSEEARNKWAWPSFVPPKAP